jgi:hypothetical protein
MFENLLKDDFKVASRRADLCVGHFFYHYLNYYYWVINPLKTKRICFI